MMLCAGIAAAQEAPEPAPPPPTTPGSGLSDLQIQSRATHINTRLARIDAELQKLNQEQDRVVAIVTEINNGKEQFDATGASKQVDRLKQALDTLAKAQQKAQEQPLARAMAALGVAAGSVYKLTAVRGDPGLSHPRGEDPTYEVYFPPPSTPPPNALAEALQKAQELSVGRAVDIDALNSRLEDAKDAIAQLNTMTVPSLEDLWHANVKQAGDTWTVIKSRIDTAIKKRTDERTRLDQELGSLSHQETKKDQRDSNLTLAIFFMIGVLFAIYLATRLFPKEVQARIVESRTLVEVVGMAFLLLTIIILGTGEKIDRPVVGTLLGSIAGYIFGQNVRSGQRRESAQGGTGHSGPAQGTMAQPQAAENGAVQDKAA
jgi:hypothetical protein